LLLNYYSILAAVIDNFEHTWKCKPIWEAGCYIICFNHFWNTYRKG